MNDNIILYWVGIFSAAAFFGMWFDKRRAEANLSRMSERGLLRLLGMGGARGGLLASYVFRHKTRKQPFRGTMIFLCILQVGALIWWFFIADPIVPAETIAQTIAALAGITHTA